MEKSKKAIRLVSIARAPLPIGTFRGELMPGNRIRHDISESVSHVSEGLSTRARVALMCYAVIGILGVAVTFVIVLSQ